LECHPAQTSTLRDFASKLAGEAIFLENAFVVLTKIETPLKRRPGYLKSGYAEPKP
jgi:hypothetical protein